jgi:fatty acid desaturase
LKEISQFFEGNVGQNKEKKRIFWFFKMEALLLVVMVVVMMMVVMMVITIVIMVVMMMTLMMVVMIMSVMIVMMIIVMVMMQVMMGSISQRTFFLNPISYSQRRRNREDPPLVSKSANCYLSRQNCID